MKAFKKHILRGFISTLIVGSFTGCTEEYILDPATSSSNEPVGGISFRCSDMLETYVGNNNTAGTRAAASKNPEEKAINTLHVFLFDYTSGNLIDSQEYDNFKSYRKVSNTSFIKVPTSSEDFDGVDKDETFKKFKEKFKSVHIVAIANIDATDDASDANDDANKFFTDYSPEGKIQLAGREKGGVAHKIKNYSDLIEWVYYPRIRMNDDGTGDITKLPDAGMPMIGELGNKDRGEKPVDLSTKPTNGETYTVDMIALMSKVNVSVKLEPSQFTEQYPLLKITGYGVRNMPIAVPYIQPTAKPKDGKWAKPEGVNVDQKHADYLKKYDVTNVPMFHKGESSFNSDHFICDDEAHEVTTSANVTINKDSEPVTFSYFTFENINLPDYNAKRANGEDAFDSSLKPKYPDFIKNLENSTKAEDQETAEAMKQRWKSTFAYSDRASALVLKGEYTTHQGITYQAQISVYMGCTVGIDDPATNFMVKRNHQYDNNVVIKGLNYIRNSDDEVYNFDGRVNVVDDNPFYLAIVNERKVDAHATALPMDVWFMEREDGTGKEVKEFDHKSSIKITLDPNCKWIRMIMIPRAEMSANNFKAGTGIEDYFTTDLFDRIDDGTIIADKNGRQCGKEVTIECSPELNNSRARIYFYIDENVPTSNDDPNYKDRKTKVKIEYTTNQEGGKNITQELEIEQRALLKVSGTWIGNDNTEDNFNKNYVRWPASLYYQDDHVVWMEYYEEYLTHSDPLDEYEMKGEIYEGLKWGLEGESISFKNPEYGNDVYHLYYKEGAFDMTKWVIEEKSKDLDKVKLFNESAPPSAFHYCFGKNKRNSDGSAYYSYDEVTYKVGITYHAGWKIKGWYMPGIRELEKALVDYYGLFPEFRGNLYWSGAPTSNNDYARATAVKVVGGNKTYENSGKSSDNGYQERKNPNRIRAFYRVQ